MKDRVIVKVDALCSMAEVVLDDHIVMTGNFWDFHPGCHGHLQYGAFHTAHGLAYAICYKLGISTDTIVIDRNWRYVR